MKVGAIPEGLLERVLLGLDVVPRPLVETILAMLLARAVMAGTRAGLFEALAKKPAMAAALARRCAVDRTALVALLTALEAAGYVRQQRNRVWTNTATATRWLTRRYPRSIEEYILFCYHEWRLLDRLDDYLRTGKALDIHDTARSPRGFWDAYVRGMRALSRLAADEIAGHLALRPGVGRILDVGGAHGEYARALCRRNPALVGEVLDLAPAVAVGRKLAREANAGDPIRFRVGDALKVRLPPRHYDACLIVNLLHHLRAADARRLVARVAAALAPGGVLAIVDAFRPDGSAPTSQMEALLTLHFQLTSAAPLPRQRDVLAWVRDARLTPAAPIALRRAPGAFLLTAVRNGA